MLEAMISILVCAFGLLGFVGVQARALAAEFESHQRTQAIALVDDMVSRIEANRTQATLYVTEGPIGSGPSEDCGALVGAPRDLCEWSNAIRGSSVRSDGQAVGAMLSARGCIERPATGSDRYVVVVAWQGIVATGAPSSACGRGEVVEEALRRAASSTVCIGLLRDPAVAPALPRC